MKMDLPRVTTVRLGWGYFRRGDGPGDDHPEELPRVVVPALLAVGPLEEITAAAREDEGGAEGGGEADPERAEDEGERLGHEALGEGEHVGGAALRGDGDGEVAEAFAVDEGHGGVLEHIDEGGGLQPASGAHWVIQCAMGGIFPGFMNPYAISMIAPRVLNASQHCYF